MPTNPDLSIEDGFSITNLLNLYAHLVDACDWEGLHRVFTEDASYDMGAVKLDKYDGLEAIREALASMEHPEAHFALTPYLASPGPDGFISVRSKFLVRLKDRTVADGVYSDSVVSTPVGWRIRSRSIVAKEEQGF